MIDLERYCYFVAGTVGELLTGLFELAVPSIAPRADEVRARAVSFGLGLQIVNIVKDVRDDEKRGDSFLPTDLLPETALTTVIARARMHLARAREYTLLWPVPEGSEVRFFCAVPLALAIATLDEIEATGRTKVTRETVARIFEGARESMTDDERLTSLLSTPPRLPPQ
jgi:farnesyl-diphosphate farnesyltransferase